MLPNKSDYGFCFKLAKSGSERGGAWCLVFGGGHLAVLFLPIPPPQGFPSRTELKLMKVGGLCLPPVT